MEPNTHCNGRSLFLDPQDLEGALRVEGTDLGQYLGYIQPGSVRKQVLGDWKAFFKRGEDYELETRADELERWTARRAQANDGTFPPLAKASPRTGRIFLLASGLERFLRWSSKPNASELRLQLAAIHPLFRGADLEPGAIGVAPDPLPADLREPDKRRTLPPSTDGSAVELEFFEPNAGAPPELTDLDSMLARVHELEAWRDRVRALVDRLKADDISVRQLEDALTLSTETSPPPSLEERRFTHEVLQQLMFNLHKFHDRQEFCVLALFAAEEVLGRRLEGFSLLDAARVRVPEKDTTTPCVPKLSRPFVLDAE